MSALRLQEPPAMARPDDVVVARPQPRRVAALRLQLGVRDTPPAESYGRASHFSEAMLFDAYRRADPDREIG